jgi:hypothetical protein
MTPDHAAACVSIRSIAMDFREYEPVKFRLAEQSVLGGDRLPTGIRPLTAIEFGSI